MNFKKIKLEPAIIWKVVTCQRITSKSTWPRWVHAWALDNVKWYWSVDTLFWQLSIDHNIVSICALRLARNYEIEHWSRSSKTNGQRPLPYKSRHLDELTHEPAIWSCDTGQWLSCFDSCQLTMLWMSNIQDVNLPRHAWDTTPFLLMVSPTPTLQSVDAYVRTYIRSGIYAKYHVQIIILLVYTITHKRFVIFTCRYLKLSWNATALS